MEKNEKFKKKFFSIVIPTYEMHGKGSYFLKCSLDKIFKQSFKDFEVIISDHSNDSEIEELCKNYDVKYFRNELFRGSSSANLNNALKKSTGDWIKVLFQDDFLFDENSLLKIKDFITEKNPNWLVTSCQHSNDGLTYYNEFHPRWNDKLHLGVNTISSPSVLTMKNDESLIYFDDNLIWMMDIDYYLRLYDLYGEPSFLYEVTVVNRTWGNRLSDTLSYQIKQKEEKIIREKYDRNGDL